MPAKLYEKRLGIYIDKLTNSIENVVTKDSFKTEVLPLLSADLNQISNKKGWRFDWSTEFKKPETRTHKLVIAGNIEVIQGLISISNENDHVYMHLIESAPFNFGKHKTYEGVPGNLVAFACQQSFQLGHQGYVAFRSKTSLITHYTEKLGAVHVGDHLMIIHPNASLKLIATYFTP